MPRNGTTGVYTRTDGTRTGTTVWTQAKNAGVKIVSSGHDTHDQDIATALNDCLTQDNKIKPTANFIPNADGTLDLGSSSVTWNNQYLKGNLHLIDGNNDGARFYNASNYVELRAPGTLAANRVFTLPNADGTSGQFLSTDGAGVTSWASASGVQLITSKSASSTSVTFDSSNIGSYRSLMIRMTSLRLNDTTKNVILQIAPTDAPTSFSSFTINGSKCVAGTLTGYNDAQSQIMLNQVGSASIGGGGWLNIDLIQGGFITVTGMTDNGNGTYLSFSGSYLLPSGSGNQMGAVRLLAGGGTTFLRGDVVLYGIPTS